ncbi:Txe/YoeB family addiction module toxin [Acidithiobacillus thiooxidans]|uniref:Putative mRNA interferase YoeB n=2 Tax=Acidithiobacillus thiooxidans TaxID=930 RepID=A0A1C2I587_ACITH|nr:MULTISPECIES: Txe/YoeB family addiction module toxin [Acidithiobacillus]MBU2742592.1 Txe/YoeB family addiction module toxin [Acidithiobacillus albertensis]MBU2749693.1 Txe/YoeB family addiction module toxin [Acidithiobacillus thiooxidans]MBU2793976.1 Txe/YoeB family addiction module toxin [Acidithiobacillus thiooxidans]OCX71161.1 addiction module protein [Acidithiobacillus thiooxidans]OCX84876.1 addiction module protein [Acidithiobacillus thiooxidans]
MPERICWTLAAWEDYQYWQRQDRKTLRRVNMLIQDCLRNPHSGIGKPEPLRENLSGYWSRRIDDVNRLVYRSTSEELIIISVRYYY